MATIPDIQFANYGSIILATPLTEAGLDWTEINLDVEDAAMWGASYVIEPRYLEDIVLGARADGLVCHG